MKTIYATTLAVLGIPVLFAQVPPRAAADELLAADRAFAAAGSGKDVIAALGSMFSRDVAMTHAGGVAYGLDQALAALKANPINAGRIEWTPARVSVSGDGLHGFTAGVMTSHSDGGSRQTPMKYLAYWEKQQDGWRVLAYKRGIAKQPSPPMAVTYVLPKQISPSLIDAPTLERHRDSLAEVERSFSRDAQTMGIGPAFKQYGDPEAINLGGPEVSAFLLGNEQIGQGVGSGSAPNSSPVSWGPEKTIIARSADFGVTIGYIVPNKPDPGSKGPARFAFFTIWRRDSPTAPWKYIAE
jgi:ketosteroid isomerase-like protein